MNLHFGCIRYSCLWIPNWHHSQLRLFYSLTIVAIRKFFINSSQAHSCDIHSFPWKKMYRKCNLIDLQELDFSKKIHNVSTYLLFAAKRPSESDRFDLKKCKVWNSVRELDAFLYDLLLTKSLPSINLAIINEYGFERILYLKSMSSAIFVLPSKTTHFA